MSRFGRTDLPEEQAVAMRKAVRIEIFTICYTTVTIGVVALVLGNSQAMKTAWVEDILSLTPQVAFLVALIFVRRRPTKAHPFGLHRAMSVGHLVAGVALFVVGTTLAWEAISGFLRGDHPTIGTVVLFGSSVWLGWVMIAVMAVIAIGPPFYGRYKLKLAKPLHNKLLYADADMAKADWQTNAASIVGVLGIGVGLWWLDAAAALFISVGIIWDGLRNMKTATLGLLDKRAATYDEKSVHPLIAEVASTLRALPWVADAAVRMRDLGQVFHVEAFVVPTDPRTPVEAYEAASRAVAELDWKVEDVEVIPVSVLPVEADRGVPDDGEPHADGSDDADATGAARGGGGR
ncbi:cation diffusion facilitator family transporter [Agromyces sp. CFH 90414]|uniref:Cation diffusion facilitator family transporter n=1 Tax=Agromyces agglutinans TaxID=2662258 RepID=A0A6I2F8I8_9MICO|nr:cation diffusion facilitator family transporter [Agromyces agglutinans]MRG60651.1 cation diffusion facilitator family transporter [Agromyces agglutinans]